MGKKNHFYTFKYLRVGLLYKTGLEKSGNFNAKADHDYIDLLKTCRDLEVEIILLHVSYHFTVYVLQIHLII